jgi:hypothetical protein
MPRLAYWFGSVIGFRSSKLEDLHGFQMLGIYNGAQSVSGYQSGFYNGANDVRGFQQGAINIVDERVHGVQLASFVNNAQELVGLQLAGVHDKSDRVVGVQITSLVNEAEELRGLQIGALNFNASGPLPFFPIFNFEFGSGDDETTTGED